tara:strand:+ start:7668 stop:8210 length:543 start_codon:yes stop_codon:yes gene_type:complete
MKTLILIIVGIFFNFNLLFSQEKIDLEFFEYYKKSFYLDGDFLKYDLGIGEVITDTIMKDMVKNKIVRFPKRCDATLDDYTDYSYCLTGNELESGFLLSNFYISYDEENNEDLFSIFIKKLEKDINEENYQIFSYEKINCKIFSFKRSKDLDVYDPNTLELIDTIHIEKYIYVLIVTMYE